MGWFDKKSWQLRRKIRDLQSELAIAERQGKYVVSQGLFFAELQEMGDQTMMVLGAADQLDSGEEDVIRNFFERNGFTIEALRVDKTHKRLAEVEIIPPEELTKHVARVLQEREYRLIDDSDQERSSDLEKHAVTLSSLLRSITVLFTEHVYQLIISTPIKLNMEGNRLLHWMPMIRDTMLAKAPAQMIPLCVEPFIEGYNHYYGQFGRIGDADALRYFAKFVTNHETAEARPATAPSLKTEFSESTSALGPSTWSRPGTPGKPAGATTATPPAPRLKSLPSQGREAAAARTLAHMYRSLIGASDQRKVRNATALLDDIGRFFEAKSICILTKASPTAPLMLHANSGSSFCVATSDDGEVTCDSEIMDRAMETGKITFSQPQGNGNKNVDAVAASLHLEADAKAVLYMVEPGNFSTSDDDQDAQHFMEFSRVFREYPDLLL